MTRVYVLAESDESAESLAILVADDDRFEVVGAAANSRASRSSLTAAQPDVVLASLIPPARLPDVSVPVVLLISERFERWEFAERVKARLPIQATPPEVLAALIAAGQGLTVLTPAQAESILNISPVPSGAEPMVEHLTPRELQVLRMMAEGAGNKEIADQLGISDNTVKYHVASILGKLQAASRTEAVTLGIRRGLIPI